MHIHAHTYVCSYNVDIQVLYAADERSKELEHYQKVLQNRLADLEATHEEEKAKVLERHSKELRESSARHPPRTCTVTVHLDPCVVIALGTVPYTCAV
jgi:hypothetical protein